MAVASLSVTDHPQRPLPHTPHLPSQARPSRLRDCVFSVYFLPGHENITLLVFDIGMIFFLTKKHSRGVGGGKGQEW